MIRSEFAVIVPARLPLNPHDNRDRRKTVRILITCLLLAAFVLTGCQTPEQKQEKLKQAELKKKAKAKPAAKSKAKPKAKAKTKTKTRKK